MALTFRLHQGPQWGSQSFRREVRNEKDGVVWRGGRKWGRCGVDTRPQPHQDQDVRQYDVVTLQTPRHVGLEMQAAVLHEGHSVIVVEGNVGLMSVFPVERHWINWVCEAIWKLPSAPSTPWQPGTPERWCAGAQQRQGQVCFLLSAHEKTLTPPTNLYLLSFTHHKAL